jgi:PAS domain-containing protein
MAPQEIEMILARHLASYLAMPIFLVDPQGTLLFYNAAAELILGRRFDESGPLPLEEWGTIFTPVDVPGGGLAPNEMPLVIALNEQHPAHRDFWIRGLDQVPRHIEVTGVPVIGQAGRHLGALAIFWEIDNA